MKKLFNNILVPIDFTRYTEAVMKEAIELANQFECQLHIIYIQPEKSLIPFFEASPAERTATSPALSAAQQKMLDLRKKFRFDLNPPMSVFTSVHSGNAESTIVFYAIKNQIDLVILGNIKRSFLAGWARDINVNRLSKKLRCPVLTLHDVVNLEKVSNIVLPVGTFLPVRKLMFAAYLAKKYNSRLHLLARTDHDQQEGKVNAHLSKAYRLIRENIELPVECRTFPEGNIADLTLAYAKNVKADLIVINPGKESVLSGFSNFIFSRFLFNRSRIPVMTVSSLKN